MSQDEQQTAICESCKSDLNKDNHKEDCAILAKMKADQAAIDAKKEKEESERLASIAKKNADAELERLNAEKIESIKNDLKEKHKKESNEIRLKNTVIDRLYKLEPRAQEEFSRTKLLDFTLDELSNFYTKVRQALEEEKNSEFDYIVFCKSCNMEIGRKKTEEGAKLFLKQHKLEQHKTKSNWVAIAIFTSLLVAGAYAGYKIYNKRKENKK